MKDTTLDLFGVGDRAVARRSDPDTSHEAADSVTRDAIADTHTRIMLLLYAKGPLTDEGIAHHWAWTPVSPSGLRTRRKELVLRGSVSALGEHVAGEWSPTYGRTKSGRRSMLWDLTAEGERAVDAHYSR